MSIFKRREKKQDAKVAFLTTQEAWDTLCVQGYTSLDKSPEIMAACYKIAEIIGSATIHLMTNTEDGDKRIINELSRKVDITPMPTMTRQTWMTGIVMTMLLYGKGNAIVVPHTKDGYLDRLEPIAAERVTLQPVGMSYEDYDIVIDGVTHRKPEDVLHFVYNPDKTYLWKGRGIEVSLREVADGLKQAAATKNAFLKSEYKPSLIVKVDGMIDEFATPEGREKLLKEYVNPSSPGAPWMIPADQFDVQQVKPLTLADLAISDQVTLDKKTVASLIGVPAFVLGVGNYNQQEWNNFIQTKVMTICKNLAAELTRKILISESWYWSFNIWSMLDYDIETVSRVLLAGSDRGYVNGDEWRDRLHMNPAGLKEYKVLENYIPYEDSGNQKKLIQEGD